MLMMTRRNVTTSKRQKGAARSGRRFDVLTFRRFDIAKSRRAFTLMEALMAAGVLLGIVVAVTSAVSAGQQNAYEAQRRIAGALAAEELMGRVAVDDYARLPTWNGFTESAGAMLAPGGGALPASMQSVGREVHVISDMKTLSGMDVRVRGQTITVRAFTTDGRTVASMTRFVAEPQS